MISRPFWSACFTDVTTLDIEGKGVKTRLRPVQALVAHHPIIGHLAVGVTATQPMDELLDRPSRSSTGRIVWVLQPISILVGNVH